MLEIRISLPRVLLFENAVLGKTVPREPSRMTSRVRRIAAVALCCMAFGFVSSTAEAQPRRFDGLPIVALDFEGLETLSRDTVEHYLLGVDRGEGWRLDIKELNESMKKLWRRELIDDIQLLVEPQGRRCASDRTLSRKTRTHVHRVFGYQARLSHGYQ